MQGLWISAVQAGTITGKLIQPLPPLPHRRDHTTPVPPGSRCSHRSSALACSLPGPGAACFPTPISHCIQIWTRHLPAEPLWAASLCLSLLLGDMQVAVSIYDSAASVPILDQLEFPTPKVRLALHLRRTSIPHLPWTLETAYLWGGSFWPQLQPPTLSTPLSWNTCLRLSTHQTKHPTGASIWFMPWAPVRASAQGPLSPRAS